ncbi:hypothetical protein TSPI_05907 [Trichinella spiralis]|uniref:Uncharacterized protein n=1 Tax=Trichinella spiralis TaxID=6334 RepID=A0ABR3KJF1_TRISP
MQNCAPLCCRRFYLYNLTDFCRGRCLKVLDSTMFPSASWTTSVDNCNEQAILKKITGLKIIGKSANPTDMMQKYSSKCYARYDQTMTISWIVSLLCVCFIPNHRYTISQEKSTKFRVLEFGVFRGRKSDAIHEN